MSRSIINKINRSGKKANTSLNVSANNNTIYEEESPLKENRRMNNTICGAPIGSPPSKFYRTSSNPFPDTSKCTSPIRQTRKKIEDSKQQKSFGKFIRYIRPNSKKKQSPLRNDESKKCDINLSLLSDTVELPSKNSEPETILSQAYEQSVNKHGDVVEYAVPYSEQGKIELQSIIKKDNENVIDENVFNESKWNDHLGDRSACNEKPPIVKITDLDKSTDGSRSLDQSGKALTDNSNKEVLSELDALERWSQNIPQRSLPPVEPPINMNVHVIECEPKEIKQNINVLRNTIAIPLHFASGTFRKTPVALRKCCPRDSTSVGLVAEAIERDYEILNNVKHSNIILLMAASFHRKSFDHMTLVLEPADYTLNYLLHQMNTTLSIMESISVVQQIASAAFYLQQCGYIHSNISSHNILVRENPWCVKLSSFELTTEVDFADTRIDILIKYRHKIPSFGADCIDLPKYTTVDDKSISLKEQYKQMSKLLPILKCSPSTQHKYLSMESKHLIYDSNYRQHLSLHNFQPPELLTTKRQFVFPTIKADVYSLCLLLWELLNKCVPFVVYNKLDMERMIASNKLNIPFFERDRCQSFMTIFRVGLASNPENRLIDVQQLITMLEDVKFRIRTGIEHQNKRLYEMEKEYEKNREHLYVNTPLKIPENNPTVNISSDSIANSIMSPDSLEFNQSINEKELTSTKKKRKKSPQKSDKKNTFRQLFKGSMETTSTDGNANENRLTDAELNETLDAIATEIRRERTLDEIKEESQSDNACDSIVIGPLVVTENELPSKMLIEKCGPTFRENVFGGKTEWRKTSPEGVDLEVSTNNVCSSKSCNNLFEASVTTSPERKKFFHPNINPSQSSGLTIGEYSMPNTPIANKNKIRRNAWLNKKLCSANNETNEETVMMENKNPAAPLDDRLNVSIRIVHNKVTPKKVNDSANPLVMSRIKFFDSTVETASTDIPIACSRRLSNVNVDEITENSLANHPSKVSSSKEMNSSAYEVCSFNNQEPASNRSTERNGTLSNCSTLPMSHKNGTETIVRDSMVNMDHPIDCFENKFWKREFDICNRSLGSSNEDEDATIITPRWQSVRDKIIKFEKRTKKPSSSITTELVKNLSKSFTGTQTNNIKFSEVPTFIKRTIYRESIVSGVGLSSLDKQMPIFDQLNLAGQKLTTQVTLNMRQIRRRSLDVDSADRCKVDGIAESSQYTICGSRKGLLSCDSGILKDGSSCGITKYVCNDCASKMSPDELKCLTFEPVTDNVTNLTLSSPTEDCQQIQRCQVRVKSQNTRSIEDLYIDDDFDQGLGANIELQSDSSDFLNFDMISTEVFNTSHVAV